MFHENFQCVLAISGDIFVHVSGAGRGSGPGGGRGGGRGRGRSLPEVGEPDVRRLLEVRLPASNAHKSHAIPKCNGSNPLLNFGLSTVVHHTRNSKKQRQRCVVVKLRTALLSPYALCCK